VKLHPTRSADQTADLLRRRIASWEAEKQATIDELPSREMYLTPANLLWLSLVTGNSTQLKGAAKQRSMQERSDEQLMTDVMAGDLAPAFAVLPGCIGLAGLSIALSLMHANMHRLLPHI
jgi:hypothetical protein